MRQFEHIDSLLELSRLIGQIGCGSSGLFDHSSILLGDFINMVYRLIHFMYVSLFNNLIALADLTLTESSIKL